MKRALAAILLFIMALPVRAAVNLLDYIPDAEEPLLTTTGVNADQYLADALAAQGDGIYYFPKGRLNFNQTIHVKHRVHFIGEGGGMQGDEVTRLVFASGISGIVFHGLETGPNGRQEPTTSASGSIIEGIHLQGSGTTGHGIWLRSRATIRDTSVDGFGENCINIR